MICKYCGSDNAVGAKNCCFCDAELPAEPVAAQPVQAVQQESAPVLKDMYEDASAQNFDSNANTAPKANTYQQNTQYPYGQSGAPQNTYQQNPYAQNPYQQNPYAQNTNTQNPYQQNPYAQNTNTQNPYRQNPYAQNTNTQNPYQQNPYAQNPYQAPYMQNPYPQQGDPYYQKEASSIKTMSIVAMIFAFLIPLVTYILFGVAKSRSKKIGYSGSNTLLTVALVVAIIVHILNFVAVFG